MDTAVVVSRRAAGFPGSVPRRNHGRMPMARHPGVPRPSTLSPRCLGTTTSSGRSSSAPASPPLLSAPLSCAGAGTSSPWTGVSSAGSVSSTRPAYLAFTSTPGWSGRSRWPSRASSRCCPSPRSSPLLSAAWRATTSVPARCHGSWIPGTAASHQTS